MSESATAVAALFTAALKLPVSERAAYVAEAAGDDSALRQRVEALLRAHEQAGDFMAQPTLDNPLGALASPLEKPGDHIGRYKLLQQIGEGGCGVVYMAEQEEPIRRRVALKIIKAGMDTKNVIARFEAERQALALMDHPNIAKVLDAGATASGRPYFVMELVRGTKITEYCDAHSLTTEQRLDLFMQVCQAVQHAHQKGIIHRDLKPSNILVTTTLEGAALPVVIDFGIAKATTNQQLTDKTLFTAFEMLIGTPAYMSPEQAVLTSTDVDTRTDIYSLGVLLYEILTGTTPFDAGELMKAGLDEVRRVIREREPVRPSSRLSKMTKGDLTAIAHHRKAEPPKLIRAVHGDLDWIVMKALEKDRTRRYETANGLALDIKRYLSDETVSARPPSTLYRFRKAVVRHKTFFASVSVVAVLLLVSLVVISVSLARERRALHEADAALQQSKAEAAKSQQVTRFLEEMLQGVGPSVAKGRDTKMLREILDKTAIRIDTALADQPATQAELENRIGTVYEQLGVLDQAEVLHRAALATNRKLFGEDSKAVADTLSYLARAQFRSAQLTEAESTYREVLTVRRKVLGPEHLDVAATLKALAGVFYEQDRIPEAEILSRESLAIRQKQLGNDSLEVADSLNALAVLLERQRKYAESEATHRKVLATRRKLLGNDHPLVASSLNNLGFTLIEQYKLAESEAWQRETLALRIKLYGEESLEAARSYYSLGWTLSETNRWTEAEMWLRKAHATELKLSGNEVSWRNANSLIALGLFLEKEGKYAEAETDARQVFDLAVKTTGHGEAAARLDPLVSVLTAQRKFSEAERLLAEFPATDFRAKTPSGEFFAANANYLARRSRWPEAIAQAALALHARPADFECYDRLAALLVATRATGPYRELYAQIPAAFAGSLTTFIVDRLAVDSLVFPADGMDFKKIDALVAATNPAGLDDKRLHYHQLGRALSEYRQGHFDGSLAWARQSAADAAPEVQAMSHAVLAMAHQQLGQKNEARAALANAEEARQKLAPAVSNDLGRSWQEWIFAQALVDEARALVGPGPNS